MVVNICEGTLLKNLRSMAAHIVGAESEPQGAHAECRTKHWNHSHKHNSIHTDRQIQTNICLYMQRYISEDTLLKKLMSMESLTQANSMYRLLINYLGHKRYR